MGILRKERGKDTYTVMSNSAITDSRLSFSALGLLLWLLSKPDHWEVNLRAIARDRKTDSKARGDGYTGVSNAMNELIEFGYASRGERRSSNGKMLGYETIVREVSILPPKSSVKPTSGKPTSGKPTSGKPTSVNETLVNTDLENTDLENSFVEDETKPVSLHQRIYDAIWLELYKTPDAQVPPNMKARIGKTVKTLIEIGCKEEDIKPYFKWILEEQGIKLGFVTPALIIDRFPSWKSSFVTKRNDSLLLCGVYLTRGGRRVEIIKVDSVGNEIHIDVEAFKSAYKQDPPKAIFTLQEASEWQRLS
jgi:hypothetical protein